MKEGLFSDIDTDKQLPAPLRFFVRLFQLILYILIQVAFIPLAVVGLLDGIYREMRLSKKLGVSFSAGQALQYRWIMHYFGTRPDPLSVAFVKKFPCESHFGLWSTLGALIISQRLFGFTTGLAKVVEQGKETLSSCAGVRVLTFDEIVEKYLGEMDQIVIPGVGFDLVALKYTKETGIRVFELDQTRTLDIKVETLRKAGIAHDWITCIPIDYSCESWVEKLLEAGFDRTKKTLFLWQSVSLFLEPEVVRETLREMADLSVDGGIIAQDFYSQAFISGKTSTIVKKNKRLIERMGEPWRFGLDMSLDPSHAVEVFLRECGLRAIGMHTLW